MYTKIKSYCRYYIKNIVSTLIKDDILKKKIIVFFYNIKNFKIIPSKEEKDIFDYKNIIKNRKHQCKEIYRGNSFYGIAKSIREYSYYDKKIKACIEHGVYFGDYVNPKETYETKLPALITFSENRKKHIEKLTSKPVFCIGPYINYAETFYTKDEIDNIKRNLGKTLLVFPTHSIDRVESSFNIDQFIDYIEMFKKKYNFETVIVCLYWKDIELKKDIIYLEKKYKVVTAGNRNDKCFLSRLKTFIEISDYTLSNSVGTHIGYCIALNKPHHIFEQKTYYIAKNKIDIKVEALDSNKTSREQEMKEVMNEFTQYSDVITSNQIEVCNKFWGLDEMKTKEEMKDILEYCHLEYKKKRMMI